MQSRHEYSFSFATLNLSERTRKVQNPFTLEFLSVPIDDGLTSLECEALREVVRSAGFAYSEIAGEGYELDLSKNERLRLRGDIEVGYRGFAVEITCKRLSDPMLELVLLVARTGNLAFMSATGTDVRLPHVSDNKLVESRWPDAALVRNTEDLRDWLENVIGGRSVRVR